MVTENERLAVKKLTTRLLSTPIQTVSEGNRLSEKHRPRIVDGMLNQGKTYGDAKGGLDFLGKENTLDYLKTIQNDLMRQIEICDEVLDQHFQMGEPILPHYFYRISIILKKSKEVELEIDFVRAYAVHCYGAPCSPSNPDAKMTARADKLGVAPENPPLWPEPGSAFG
jgi:hypothetical protein